MQATPMYDNQIVLLANQSSSNHANKQATRMSMNHKELQANWVNSNHPYEQAMNAS
jgi:hypothetical protein